MDQCYNTVMSSPSFPLPPPALPPPPPLPVFVTAGQDEAAAPLRHSRDEDEQGQRRWTELNKWTDGRTERMFMSKREELGSQQTEDEISVEEGLLILVYWSCGPAAEIQKGTIQPTSPPFFFLLSICIPLLCKSPH